MKIKYIWRELSEDGRLLDPDDTDVGSLGRLTHLRPFNGGLGHDTEQDAIKAYEKVIASLQPWEAPWRLVLIKEFEPYSSQPN